MGCQSVFSRMGFQVLQDEESSADSDGDGCSTISMSLILLNCTFKNGHDYTFYSMYI